MRTRPPAFILRLMRYKPLRGKLKIGPEDRLSIDYANMLRVAAIEGRLQGVFTHPANELCFGHKTGVKAAISRAMGMIVGTPDYLHLKKDGSLAMEAKAPGSGKQTDNQKDFQAWCEEQGIPYRLFTTVKEGEAILMEFGFVR